MSELNQNPPATVPEQPESRPPLRKSLPAVVALVVIIGLIGIANISSLIHGNRKAAPTSALPIRPAAPNAEQVSSFEAQQQLQAKRDQQERDHQQEIAAALAQLQQAQGIPGPEASGAPAMTAAQRSAIYGDSPNAPARTSENRKSKNPLILGFQGKSQLEVIYGHLAEVMLSQPATKIFMKTAEPKAAEWISEAIGKVEIERLKETKFDGTRSGHNFTVERQVESLVMGSEITGLDDRHAYLKLGNSVARFAFDYMDLPAETPAFVPRVSADAGMKFDPDTLAPILQPESKKVPSDTSEEVVESAESSGPFDRQRAPAGITQAEAQERAISPVEAVPTEAIEESPELEEELTQGPELIREM